MQAPFSGIGSPPWRRVGVVWVCAAFAALAGVVRVCAALAALENILNSASTTVKIDMIDCGADDDDEVTVGDVNIRKYPWYGILWYTDTSLEGDRAVTQVVLIHAEFVLASAYEIDQIPKDHFRKNSRVLLGEDWSGIGRRVRNYILHPEYGQTQATLALVHLKDIIVVDVFRPVCPPPEILQDPSFYVIKFKKDDYNALQKEVVPMFYVPPLLCRDFYVQANLYEEKMRPPHVVCVCSMEHDDICIWNWSAALMTRDVWGRWVLLGMSVYGPGCSGPSRYLDMLSYYPWIHHSLSKFRVLTISKLHRHKFVLRAAAITNYDDLGNGIRKVVTRYGDCDNEEKRHRMYREVIFLKSDNNQYQYLGYNLTIAQNMEITCLSLELINASAEAEMVVKHWCPRKTWGPRCYDHQATFFDIAINVMFSDNCLFELNVFGYEKSMKLLDPLPWHWEEGTYYEDFAAWRVEYRGPAIETTFGFEPLDPLQWTPDFSIDTTEYVDNRTSLANSESLWWVQLQGDTYYYDANKKYATYAPPSSPVTKLRMYTKPPRKYPYDHVTLLQF